MQVFLPFGLTKRSMACLDSKRLGKQRVECLQILNALQGKSKGWRHHPATLMFRGAEEALKIMGDWAIAEWVKRGYKNNMEPFSNYPTGKWASVPQEFLPEWYSNKKLRTQVKESHRLNLMRKNFDYYSKYFFGTLTHWRCTKEAAENAQYVWPVTLDDIKVKEVLSICP